MRDVHSDNASYPGTVLRIETDFKRFYAAQPYDEHNHAKKTGTGFLMHAWDRVYVWTAHHVVSNAVRVMATTPNHLHGEPRELTLVACNPHLDVAVLRGDDDLMGLPAFRSGNASDVALGREIYILGHGNGTLRLHHTRGGISGRRGFPHNRWQTDCVVHPGNSGGPAIDTQTGHVLGICTSGENDMQPTNYFVGCKEAFLAMARAMQSLQHPIDLGYDLNCVFAPVDSNACAGRAGGAMVLASRSPVLQRGDVVRAIEDAAGNVCELNVYMRVKAPSICSFETMDFRTVLDHLTEPAAALRVRRAGDYEDTTLRVALSSSRIGTRELFVDAEPVPYAVVGGLVVVMLSKTHMHDDDEVADGAIHRALRDPDVALRSRPLVTYVLAGSPFDKHGANKLVNSVLEYVNGVRVQTLEAVWNEYQKSRRHAVLTLDNGAKVGALQTDLEAYDRTSDPVAGIHVADVHRCTNTATRLPPNTVPRNEFVSKCREKRRVLATPKIKILQKLRRTHGVFQK